MRTNCLCTLLVIVLVIGSGMARVHAAPSETTATVRVRWVAPPGLAPHALVELTSTDTPPLTLKAEILEPADVAIIRGVPAGRYRLAVYAGGFREALASVDVRAATTYEYVAVLAATTQTNTESTLEQVHAKPAANAQIFDQQFIETFPGEDVLWSLVETAVAPLVVDQIADGGLRVGEAALVGGLGSSWRDTAIVLGPLDVTDPARPGTPLVRTEPCARGSAHRPDVDAPGLRVRPRPGVDLPAESACDGLARRRDDRCISQSTSIRQRKARGAVNRTVGDAPRCGR